MTKVIMVLCDGLRYDTAVEMMGYLEHMVEVNLGSRYQIQGELPSISRPMYETIITGTPVDVHGVTSNFIVRPSSQPGIFTVAHENGRVTAASAYFWISELYNGCPYVPGRDKECNDESLPIQYGRFYTTDNMPDEETFHTGQLLVSKYKPDFLLIHPMGMDTLGHDHGPESNEYRNNALLIDILLASHVPGWLADGYTVLVTADHGMGSNNSHNGTLPESRLTPLYLLQPGQVDGRVYEGKHSMLAIAPTMLKIMGLPIPDTMKTIPLV